VKAILVEITSHIMEKLDLSKPCYVFLDEVQNVKEFERLVDGLFVKPGVDVYITGSNAYLLSGELGTLLTGRYISIHILPFSSPRTLCPPNPQSKALKTNGAVYLNLTRKGSCQILLKNDYCSHCSSHYCIFILEGFTIFHSKTYNLYFALIF